jgi:hypothetical protein
VYAQTKSGEIFELSTNLTVTPLIFMEEAPPTTDDKEPVRDAQFVEWSCGCIGLVIKHHCWVIAACDIDLGSDKYSLFERIQWDGPNDLSGSPKPFEPLSYGDTRELLDDLCVMLHDGQDFARFKMSIAHRSSRPLVLQLCDECEMPISFKHHPTCSKKGPNHWHVTQEDCAFAVADGRFTLDEAEKVVVEYPTIPTFKEAAKRMKDKAEIVVDTEKSSRERHEDESAESLAELEAKALASMASPTCVECARKIGNEHAGHCSQRVVQDGNKTTRSPFVRPEDCVEEEGKDWDEIAKRVRDKLEQIEMPDDFSEEEEESVCLDCGSPEGESHLEACGHSEVTKEQCTPEEEEEEWHCLECLQPLGKLHKPKCGKRVQDCPEVVQDDCLDPEEMFCTCCQRKPGELHDEDCNNTPTPPDVTEEQCLTEKEIEESKSSGLVCTECGIALHFAHSCTCSRSHPSQATLFKVLREQCCAEPQRQSKPSFVFLVCPECRGVLGSYHADDCSRRAGPNISEVLEEHCVKEYQGRLTESVCLSCKSKLGAEHKRKCAHWCKNMPFVQLCQCVEEC